MQLIGGGTVFFDAYGWNAELGFDQALRAIGWTSTVSKGGDAREALGRLAAAAGRGRCAGPLEMGHLRYQPEMTGPIGADHYVVVLDVDDERVLVHDPQGYPYAGVPVGDFLTAWRAETVNYGEPYTMRSGFAKVAHVADADAIRSIIPTAIERLSMCAEVDMPPGSLGNGEAAERVAEMIEAGADDGLREHLIYFAIRAGARMLSDTADCLLLASFPRGGHRGAAGAAGGLDAVPDGGRGLPAGRRGATRTGAHLRPVAGRTRQCGTCPRNRQHPWQYRADITEVVIRNFLKVAL